jgi:hypothetical protein
LRVLVEPACFGFLFNNLPLDHRAWIEWLPSLAPLGGVALTRLFRKYRIFINFDKLESLGKYEKLRQDKGCRAVDTTSNAKL